VILTMPGLRPTNLSTYLAGLGLMRIAAAQFDPSTRAWWDGSALCLEVTRDGLADFLIDEYRPTPILSPWNGGSGYGEKDKAPRVALDRLLASGADRLTAFVATDRAIGRVRSDVPSGDKATLVQALRNRAPDEALPWLDAAVVLTREPSSGKRKTVFPPLLGTGGNDGRYDFSTNFHQRLADVLPELGAKRSASLAWLDAALSGASVALARATIGQFDPLAAGGPDDDGSYVNPWLFVLMMEGLVSFASAPVRRLGESGSRAAMPFTVNSSPAGPVPGSGLEEARGELWAPVWDRPLGAREVRHIFASARTSWDGRTATSAAHMYAALRSCGIDRRVSRFVRYGLLQRNGLSFSAVLLDEVTVNTKPSVELGIAVERRAQRFLRAQTTNRLEPVLNAYEVARTGFYREVESAQLAQFLVKATEVERAVMLTQAGRDSVSRADRRLAAQQAVPVLKDRLAIPEYRIAAGLASTKLRHAGSSWSMADLLLGRPPTNSTGEAQPAVVDGFGMRPLVSVLSDLMIWRLAHRSDDSSAPSSAGSDLMDSAAASTPWQDVHQWVAGQLDDTVVQEALKAMMALEWGERVAVTYSPRDVLPNAALAILQPFARRDVTVNDTLDDSARRGIEPDWPSLLAAGRQRNVLERAVRVLNRSSVYAPSASGSPAFVRVIATVPKSFPEATRLAAALWVPTHHMAALRRVATLLAPQDADRTTTPKEISS
jgi:CRISPR-associated protein Csx17